MDVQQRRGFCHGACKGVLTSSRCLRPKPSRSLPAPRCRINSKSAPARLPHPGGASSAALLQPPTGKSCFLPKSWPHGLSRCAERCQKGGRGVGKCRRPPPSNLLRLGGRLSHLSLPSLPPVLHRPGSDRIGQRWPLIQIYKIKQLPCMISGRLTRLGSTAEPAGPGLYGTPRKRPRP